VKNSIIFFFRKPKAGVFSIEKLFINIQQFFPSEVTYHNIYSTKFSEGILNRFYILKEAFLNRGRINHITGDISFIAIALPKNKTILTIHDIESFKGSNNISDFIIKFFWLRIPLKLVRFVTVVSEETKTVLLKNYKINPQKVIVIPNIVSPRFKYVPKNIFNSRKPVILQIGTKYNKNIERTIQALDGINCEFIIIGKLSREQIKLLEKYQVYYTNMFDLSEEELIQAYINADIVSFVSLFEGFGLPILEAQAIGRAVITSNCSSMPEVSGDAAVLVNPFSVESIHEGFMKIINDENLRIDLIEKGLVNVKRFDPNRIAKDYLDLYSRI
jgi:glycosyltransferase involved in cell wall biosynthesis